jgi:hypothetical protein
VSDPKQEHVNCYLLQHRLDGTHFKSNEKVANHSERSREGNIALLESVAVATVNFLSPEMTQRVNNFDDHAVLQVSDIIDDILLRVHKHTERDKRSQYISDVCGDFGLGIIQPTIWPPPEEIVDSAGPSDASGCDRSEGPLSEQMENETIDNGPFDKLKMSKEIHCQEVIDTLIYLCTIVEGTSS